jgi:hypothetical protein
MISLLSLIWQSLLSLRFNLEARQREILQALQSLQDGQRAIHRQLAQVLDTLIPGPAVKLVFTVHLDDGTSHEAKEMETIRDDQKQTLSIQPIDDKKKPALVDGVPTWASSDETVVTVAAAADGMSAEVVGVAPGTARVVVTADADLGSGVTPLTGVQEYTVTAGAATTLSITAAPPASQ